MLFIDFYMLILQCNFHYILINVIKCNISTRNMLEFELEFKSAKRVLCVKSVVCYYKDILFATGLLALWHIHRSL